MIRSLVPALSFSTTLAKPSSGSLVLFVGLALFFFELGHSDLIASHEARAAQNAQRMLNDGAFAQPTLFDGQVDLQKPPGFYWLAAFFGFLNGGTVTPFTMRLPSAIAGLLTVIAVHRFLCEPGRETTATLAALTLATAVHFTSLSRIARIDMPLTAAVSVSLLSLVRSAELTDRHRLVWSALAGIAAAAAILLKGPIGLVLILGVAGVHFLVERTRPSTLAILIFLGTAVLVSLPWFLWMNAHTGGEFLRVFVWHHNVARFLGTSPTLASHPWWYYLPRFGVDFLPWTPAFVFLTLWSFSAGLWKSDRTFRLGVTWFVVMFVILSASRFKRADYLLPAYPGAAIALSSAALHWYRSRERAGTRSLAASGFATVIGLTLLVWPAAILVLEPRLDAKEEKRPFAEAIRHEAPQPNLVLLFRVESHLLAFHLGRPLHTLVEWGELNNRLAEPGPHYLVTQPIYAEEVKAILPHHHLETVASLEDFTTAKPARPLVFLRKRD